MLTYQCPVCGKESPVPPAAYAMAFQVPVVGLRHECGAKLDVDVARDLVEESQQK